MALPGFRHVYYVMPIQYLLLSEGVLLHVMFALAKTTSPYAGARGERNVCTREKRRVVLF